MLILLFIYGLVLIPFINFHLSDPHSFQRIKDTMGIDIKQSKNIELTKTTSTRLFIDKYLMHFSYTFLFENGDADFPGQFIRRHSISGLGELYPYQLIFIIIGAGWSLGKLSKKNGVEFIFPLLILTLYPLADSLTLEHTPFATRSYLGVIPFHILIAFGIYCCKNMLEQFGLWKQFLVKTVFCLYFSYLIISSLNNLQIKFLSNPNTTSDFWGWQFGARDIITYFKENESKFDQLIMEPRYNSPEIFLNFYAPYSCRKCRIGDLSLFNPKLKQVFALSSETINFIHLKNYRILNNIYYPNNQLAFSIFEKL